MPITGNPNDPEFNSEHRYLLFLSLPVLRQVAPDLLNSLLESKSQFAAAANLFPLGIESVHRPKAPDSGVCEDCIPIGSTFGTEKIRRTRASFRSQKSWQMTLREPLRAFRRHAEDPNDAPKECWRLRTIFAISYSKRVSTKAAMPQNISTAFRCGPSALCQDRTLRGTPRTASTRFKDLLSQAHEAVSTCHVTGSDTCGKLFSRSRNGVAKERGLPSMRSLWQPEHRGALPSPRSGD
jgi:hypothetical protein